MKSLWLFPSPARTGDGAILRFPLPEFRSIESPLRAGRYAPRLFLFARPGTLPSSPPWRVRRRRRFPSSAPFGAFFLGDAKANLSTVLHPLSLLPKEGQPHFFFEACRPRYVPPPPSLSSFVCLGSSTISRVVQSSTAFLFANLIRRGPSFFDILRNIPPPTRDINQVSSPPPPFLPRQAATFFRFVSSPQTAAARSLFFGSGILPGSRFPPFPPHPLLSCLSLSFFFLQVLFGSTNPKPFPTERMALSYPPPRGACFPEPFFPPPPFPQGFDKFFFVSFELCSCRSKRRPLEIREREWFLSGKLGTPSTATPSSRGTTLLISVSFFGAAPPFPVRARRRIPLWLPSLPFFFFHQWN